MQVVNLTRKRDAGTGFTLSNRIGWMWTAQEKSTDSRDVVMKAAALQINNWGGRKILTSFFNRTHTTVIVHSGFNIETHKKKKVACIHKSIFTSISIHISIYQKWENPNIYI